MFQRPMVKACAAGGVLGFVLLAAVTAALIVFDGFTVVKTEQSMQHIGTCLALLHRERGIGAQTIDVVPMVRAPEGGGGRESWEEIGGNLDKGWRVPASVGLAAMPPDGAFVRVKYMEYGLPILFITGGPVSSSVRILPLLANWMCWSFIAAAAILLVGFVRENSRSGANRCVRCGYPRTTSAVCPECGRPYEGP